MTNDSEATQDASPLYAEHLLLGATFDDETYLDAPVHYGAPEEEREAFTTGCALGDLSGMSVVLVSGEASAALVQAACANEPLAVGECCFGAVVTGDGSLASVPLVARTGDAEYLICDISSRGLTLHPWLSFLSDIEQQGFKPFEGAKVENVSDALVPLVLWGPEGSAVLGDYVKTLDDLPAEGHVANVHLDRIGCLAIGVPRVEGDCYLLLVPPQTARILWRSFLSFVTVSPAGTHALTQQLSEALPWAEALRSEDRLEPSLRELLAWEVARASGGFVGERALSEK